MQILKELLRHNLEILRLGIKNIPKNKLKLIWYELAYTYAALNEQKEAMYAVRQYIKLSPSEPFPYVAQGDVYAFFMKYDSSRASYEKALEFRDDIHFLQLLLGNYDVIRAMANTKRRRNILKLLVFHHFCILL